MKAITWQGRREVRYVDVPEPKIEEENDAVLLPLLSDGDPLGVEPFATHRIRLAEAAAAYEAFGKKANGTVKVVMSP